MPTIRNIALAAFIGSSLCALPLSVARENSQGTPPSSTRGSSQNTPAVKQDVFFDSFNKLNNKDNIKNFLVHSLILDQFDQYRRYAILNGLISWIDEVINQYNDLSEKNTDKYKDSLECLFGKSDFRFNKNAYQKNIDNKFPIQQKDFNPDPLPFINDLISFLSSASDNFLVLSATETDDTFSALDGSGKYYYINKIKDKNKSVIDIINTDQDNAAMKNLLDTFIKPLIITYIPALVDNFLVALEASKKELAKYIIPNLYISRRGVEATIKNGIKDSIASLELKLKRFKKIMLIKQDQN